MNTVITIGNFSIEKKEMEIKMTEDEKHVILFVTDKGSDVPMSSSQIKISKEMLSVVKIPATN